MFINRLLGNLFLFLSKRRRHRLLLFYKHWDEFSEKRKKEQTDKDNTYQV